MTTARLTGPNPDRSQDRPGFESFGPRRDARATGVLARRTARAAATGSRPRVYGCAMRFAFIFINRCALATAHGPRPDVRHTPGQRRAPTPDTPVGPRTRPDTPGTYYTRPSRSPPR